MSFVKRVNSKLGIFTQGFSTSFSIVAKSHIFLRLPVIERGPQLPEIRSGVGGAAAAAAGRVFSMASQRAGAGVGPSAQRRLR